MGMNDPGICHIGNFISILQEASCIDHILVEDGMLHKAATFVKGLFIIHGTDIRTEEGLDPHDLQICPAFDAALRWIIKGSGVFFYDLAVFSRKLPRIGRPDQSARFLKGLCQISDQMPVCRNGILGHKEQKIRSGHVCHGTAGTAMVKRFRRNVAYTTKRILLFQRSIPVLLFCIYNDHLMNRVILLRKAFQQCPQGFARFIDRDQNIYCQIFHIVFELFFRLLRRIFVRSKLLF